MTEQKTEQKKKFVDIECKVIVFDAEDVILTSGFNPLDPYELEED